MNIGRNDPCHCGSGKKYKHCCLSKETGLRLPYKLCLAIGVLIFVMSLVMIINSLREFEPRSTSRVWSEEHQHWHSVN